MKINFFGKEGLDTPKSPYNIITLPSFTNREASMMTPYLNLTIRLNTMYMFTFYIVSMWKIQKGVINNLRDEPELLSDWEKGINRIREEVVEEIEKTLPHYKGGRLVVAMDNTYIQDFAAEILELKPIKILSTDRKEHPSSGEVENLFSEIKDEVKKGNRVSFKLMQELQSTIEGLTSNTATKDKELIEAAIKDYEKKAGNFLKLAMKAVDSLDLIYQSALKTNLTEWTIQIKSVIEDFLQQLESIGIEETKAEGQFFDGESMISIGTVAAKTAPHLKKFQVYSVHERGFRYKEDGKLIREAKVTTIY